MDDDDDCQCIGGEKVQGLMVCNVGKGCRIC